MDVVKPYAPPQSSLVTEPEETGEFDQTSPFSIAGRFGRAAYIVHVGALYIVWMLLMTVGMLMLQMVGDTSTVLTTVIFFASAVVMLGVSFVFMIRRLHDLNWSAWLCLLGLVPIANIIIAIPTLFFRGTEGPNDFGPPRQRVRAHTFIVIIFTVIFGIGIAASVTIPAYQQYTLERGQQSVE